MNKTVTLFLFAVMLSISAFAQSIQEGVNHLYAERTTSAKAVFEKLIAANPNNLEAVYWLGQTHLINQDVPAARSVYEKALVANGNAPLILVGMGHVELIEEKKSEARQRFETAISLSRGRKGDDPNILNAIGRANVESNTGDIAYAIAKLNDAAKLAPNNSDVYINLGNAYRKAKDGGQAITAYMRATANQPALANYRMARLYETQRNWDVVTEHLNRAIAADPKFAPAYLRQYVYNLFHKNDYNAADEWAKKYIANTDQSVQNDYFRAQALYQQKNYNEAINVSQNIIQQSGNQPVNPSVYRLLSYSYMEKGDTSLAKTYVDQLFEKTDKEEFVAKDYTLKAAIYSKESPEEVVNIYLDAANEDTSIRNKQLILLEAIQWAKENNKKIPEGDLTLAFYKISPEPNPAMLFQVGLPYYQAGAYRRADSAFKAYSQHFPDSTYGYLWSARSLGRIDSTMEQGLAIPMFEKLLEVSEKDKEKNKAYGVEAAANLASYYVNVKGDREKGILYLTKALEFDPNNEAFKSNLDKLRGSAKPAAAKKPTASVPKK
jgi:tetratricopeptide (TPR) repeat protein